MLSAYKTAEIKREEDRSLIKVEKLERERERVERYIQHNRKYYSEVYI